MDDLIEHNSKYSTNVFDQVEGQLKVQTPFHPFLILNGFLTKSQK